jgi:hypothetical protein
LSSRLVVWLNDDVAAEIYGTPFSPVQKQAVYNAMRTLSRRGLVVLNPQCLTEYGFPECRHRARLADTASSTQVS